MSAMTVSGLTGEPHRKFGSNDNLAGVRVWDTLTLSEPATITLAGSVEGRFRFLDTLDLTPFPASLDLDIAFHRDNPDFEEGGGEGGPVPLIEEGSVGRFYEAPVTAGSPIQIDEDYSVQVSLPAGTHYFTLELSVETGSDTYGNNGIWHSVATEADFADTLTFRIEVPDGVAASSGSGLLPIGGGETADETPAAISCDDAPAGWQGENVAIACTASDAGSGLADPGDASFSLATTVPAGVETDDATTGEREVCDAAGNCATAGPIGGIWVDRKAPEIAFGAVSPAANANGWHNGDVSIAFTAVDGGSGVASTAPAASPLVLTGEGAAVSAAVTATDAVGNVASAVSPAAAIDRTAPTVAFSGNAGSYEVDEDVMISCPADDALSGLDSDTCADVSGPAYSFGVGTSSFSATATDLAGNVGAASTSFEVTVSSAALGALVERFVESAGVEHALLTKLEKGYVKPFVHQVEALAGEKLSQEHAHVLLRLAQALSNENR